MHLSDVHTESDNDDLWTFLRRPCSYLVLSFWATSSFTPLSIQISSHKTTRCLSFHVWIIPTLGRNTMGDCVRPTLFPIQSPLLPPPPPIKSGPTLTMAKQTKIPRLRPEAALSCNTLEATAIPNYWIYSSCQEILGVQLSENMLINCQEIERGPQASGSIRGVEGVRSYADGRTCQEIFWVQLSGNIKRIAGVRKYLKRKVVRRYTVSSR